MSVFWVTGASSGFGHDCAVELLKKGHTVYVSARNAESMKDLAQMCAKVLPVDVTKEEDIQQAVAVIQQEQGRLDGLLANAGYGVYGMVESIPINDIQKQFDVNVFGVARCIQAVLPMMRQARFGRIVITESLAAHASTVGIGWYAASKHALRGMHVALRQEVAALGVKVIAIEPGRVKTRFGNVACEGLLEREKEADYQQLSRDFVDYMDRPTMWRTATTQSTVDAMVHALTAPKPRTVYRTTKDARLFPILLKLLPNAWYDSIILKKITGQI